MKRLIAVIAMCVVCSVGYAEDEGFLDFTPDPNQTILTVDENECLSCGVYYHYVLEHPNGKMKFKIDFTDDSYTIRLFKEETISIVDKNTLEEKQIKVWKDKGELPQTEYINNNPTWLFNNDSNFLHNVTPRDGSTLLNEYGAIGVLNSGGSE